ncbi:outer membrane protein assembly factor [Psychrobacter sp. CCUG 69069]|jgi:translocation and assembly module TamA|uniref:autotransporter assembly complex protein TamA n=1 Tax=Psychrobacter sp. CCUG 69069 TaxID=2282777 RepID=UPI001E2A2498|nr:BamA/TamA family outer membrane protein [Psychrobacter sp. CCUG 69069]MCD1279205.1 outer membrane protein assembly factor [Psychrobacter sp. CCUG 69069]
MKNQPSTLASNVSVKQRNTISVQSESHTRTTAPRTHFTRSALFTALATSLVGFGIAPAALADTTNSGNTPDQSMTNQVAPNQIVANPPTSLMDDDTQLDRALDALHLKKAVEQGIIEQSVLDDYSEQSLGIKKSDTPSQNLALSQDNAKDEFDTSEDVNSPNSAQLNFPSSINEDLSQQAAAVQQQGYQMMTPEQIDRELAAMDLQNAQDINNIGNVPNDSDFDTPIATLNDATPPIGLDVELDATNLPAPSNLDTLGRNETDAETAEIMSRPINVSDAVSSGRVDDAGDNSGEMVANASTEDDTPSDVINPDDYLPDYQTETQAVNQSLEQASKPKPLARNSSNIVKRLYNRLFNGGAMALPHVETTVYLQQEASAGTVSGQPNIIKADNDVQPMKNIKAALDDTTVQSVVDFTAALPRLRETALDAAKAVGYYDVTLRLRQPNRDTIDVIIEELGEPVRVDSRIVDIRGEGSEQEEFVTLEETLPPQEGDIFNHRVYKNSKAALESLSNTYGYFDEYWLNKSVDVILPDNTADVSLVYNTGDRYEFDEVVFFTYDEETNTLTQDPDKLPVELSLLQQLFDFEPGDPFYRPAVTKFSNDLSATRYFNTVNVESILPPDERSEASTLDFDNAPAMSNNQLDDDINNAGVTDTTGSNEDVSLAAINDRSNSRKDDANGSMSDNADDKANNDEVVAEGESSLDTNNTETVNAADIAAIEFEADEETLDKLQAIRQKAERLSNLPNDRVLDEKDQEADNLLGKISDSISNIAQKIFPDEESIIADENFVPPTLAGRKTPQEVAESKKVPLYVFVSSSKPRDAQVGLGYGTDTGVRATAKIDYNLLNRQGYQAGAETEVSRITKNVTVYASRPWKHPLNDTLEGRLTYEEEVIDQGEGNFDLSTSTLKAALARNIRRESGWNRSYSVRYRLDELETGVDETELDDLPIRFTSSKPKQQALLFGYGINKTDVDSATNPTRGIRQYYAIEAGADKALSDTDLAIVRAGVSGIYSFGEDKKHQVLGSVNAGYIWADDFYDVPYKLRFFAGGDQSIRGYDYESLSPLDKGYLTGGQILAVGSAEYNYEFRPGFRGAFFTDVGNAYDKDFETETKVGVGVGIRWASPVGVVRVDVAAGVTEESIPVRLHFFIGSPL